MENSNYIPPRIEKNAEGYNIFYNKKYLYPEKNTLTRINTKIESYKIEENTLIIVPSPLLYLGTDKIISVLNKNCSIIFIEHDRNLFKLKANPHRNYESILAENENDIFNFCRDFDYSSYRKIILLPLNNGYFINRSFYNYVLDIFRKNMNRYWKNKITRISLGSRWYTNIFRNLHSFFKGKSISELKIKGPVFVAGAGESLEAALPLLKKHKDLLTVIAIDTAAGTLINFDIKPDYILAVESQFYNLYDFYGCLNSGIPLICDISAYPETLRITGGNNYFFFSEFSGSSFLKYLYQNQLLPGKIPPLGSVGVIAVYISLMLTDSFIIYSGLDFSFVPGKSHSKNSPFITLTSLLAGRTDVKSNYAFCLRGDYSAVDDVNGKKVITNSSLKSYAASFKELLSSYKRIYSLFPAGIASNPNVLHSEKELLDLIRMDTDLTEGTTEGTEDYDYIKTSKQSEIFEQSGTEDYKKTSLKDFYISEYNNLKKIIKISVDFLNSRADEDAVNVLRKMLSFSDYITEDFPESALPDQITAVYLKRVLLSSYKYERILEHIINSKEF